jgi:hypothetical protein
MPGFETQTLSLTLVLSLKERKSAYIGDEDVRRDFGNKRDSFSHEGGEG